MSVFRSATSCTAQRSEGNILFYHSIDWGFDTAFIEKKRKAKEYLDSLSLPCCIDGVCNANEAKRILDTNNPGCYLVTVKNPRTNQGDGYFGIQTFSQLLEKMKKSFGQNCSLDEFEFCVIEQLEKIPGCFTSIIMSDGKGNAVVEYLEGTVDNRFLSSGGEFKGTPQRIIFCGYDVIYCNNFSVLKRLYSSVKTCLYFKGYYECTYATLHGEPGVFFSYFSTDQMYQNIFSSFDFYMLPVNDRCSAQYLFEAGFLY